MGTKSLKETLALVRAGIGVFAAGSIAGLYVIFRTSPVFGALPAFFVIINSSLLLYFLRLHRKLVEELAKLEERK